MHYDFFPGMAPVGPADKLKHIITRFTFAGGALTLITFAPFSSAAKLHKTPAPS